MPKKIFEGQARLMAWEWHLLDAISRIPLSTRLLHGYLLEIYECTDDKITHKDIERCLDYLRSLGYIQFRSSVGAYYCTDAGLSFVFWVNHLEYMKSEYFKGALQ